MRGVGDDDLDRLAAALGIEDIEREAVLLEDAGVLSKLGDEGLADAARADRKLELVLRAIALDVSSEADGQATPTGDRRPGIPLSRFPDYPGIGSG